MKFTITFLVFVCVVSAIMVTVAIMYSVNFGIKCKGHLENAGNANSIELAISELTLAVKYLEDNRITSGTTGVFFDYPQNDVGFWYRNLSGALIALKELPSASSELEKSNVLIKLRETLRDFESDGPVVTHPSGISFFPNNAGWTYAELVLGGLWLVVIGLGIRIMVRDLR